MGSNPKQLREDLEDYQDNSVKEKQSNLTTDIIAQQNDINVIEKPVFSEVIHKVDKEVGFWKTERGLKLKEAILTEGGRVLRMFVTVERYDNWWQDAKGFEVHYMEKHNKFDEIIFNNHGSEWALSYLILCRLGGALKLVTDDRWIDHPKYIRTPEKKDCTVEAIDLRKSGLSIVGMKYFENVGYVRYLNLADSKFFDNHCLACLHPIADVLEYLDISGTLVTPAGFAYLRIFSKLRWLNISRLSNMSQIQVLLPFLREILPYDCVIVTDDDLPSESYGTPTLYYEDLGLDEVVKSPEDHDIGVSSSFYDTYGCKALQVGDVTTMHKLWKTPLISKHRLRLMNVSSSNNKGFLEEIVKYIVKAENYRPLL